MVHTVKVVHTRWKKGGPACSLGDGGGNLRVYAMGGGDILQDFNAWGSGLRCYQTEGGDTLSDFGDRGGELLRHVMADPVVASLEMVTSGGTRQKVATPSRVSTLSAVTSCLTMGVAVEPVLVSVSVMEV